MSRKQQRTHSEKTPRTTVVPEQPAAPRHDQEPAPALASAGNRLAGQAVRGAATGTARSVTDWLIERITEHFG
ncbi:hypothetical protein KNE206_30600 [Kitasatospora sp. NE20-6]|uniref:hypothetical protein n=1 Tax=Kitasatospora sp. NE20-6 TaxID=2859066 RepID=UPI0034DC4775